MKWIWSMVLKPIMIAALIVVTVNGTIFVVMSLYIFYFHGIPLW